jgi:putative ABC transport system substrate-binding protein
MSYAPKALVQFKRAALYVDKILRGAKPSDLPIDQPTEFELVVNVKASQGLGLTLPPSIAVQVTEWIE